MKYLGGEYVGIESVEWMDKPYNSFYSRYFTWRSIRTNKFLDSPQRLLEHDKAFYEDDHKYPDYT